MFRLMVMVVPLALSGQTALTPLFSEGFEEI